MAKCKKRTEDELLDDEEKDSVDEVVVSEGFVVLTEELEMDQRHGFNSADERREKRDAGGEQNKRNGKW